MGLIDVLNGMQNGPRGQREATSGASSSGGMSPITMAILGLLAYKAVKGLAGGQPTAAPAGARVSPGEKPINVGASESGGGLGDLLKTGLGGLLGTSAAGGVLSGGLSDLLKQFEQRGQGDTVDSWVGTGPNKAISPNDLANAIGTDKVKVLMAQTGLSREDLLSGLSEYLPQVVDRMTPKGRLPTEQEAQHML